MRAIAALAAVTLAAAPACALVETVSIDNDPRAAFALDSFGFLAGGVMELDVKEFVLMVPADYEPPANEKFNIALVFQKSDMEVLMDSSQTDNDSDPKEGEKRFCFHEDAVDPDVDKVISLASRADWNEVKFSHTVSEPGYWRLYFSNCEPHTHATFELLLTEYNVINGQRNYLTEGLSSLPTWFFFFSAIFAGMCIAWASLLAKKREDVRSIHYLMLLVVFLKAGSMFFESLKFHSLKTVGHEDAWSWLYYAFSTTKGVLMFGVIVLIGTGWSFLKPFLTERDKQIMLVTIAVQFMVNIAIVVVDEEAPGTYGIVTWRDALHFLDVVCCLVILLPIVWSIRHLKESAGVDGKAAANMARLKNFRTFYLVVVSYLYFTRVIVYLLAALLSPGAAWMEHVFREVAGIVFYAFTGYLFRPQPRNPYVAIQRDEMELQQLSHDDELDAVDAL